MANDIYSDFRQGDNITAVLDGLAKKYREAEASVALAEAALDEAKQNFKIITEQDVPEAVEGLEGKFSLSDGSSFEVKENIRVSIAGEKAAPAISWLKENDYDAIVKTEVTFKFGKGEQGKRKQFIDLITEAVDILGFVPNFTSKENVHPGTLKSWVTEKLGEGVEIPAETFGLFRQRTAKLKD